MVQQNNYTLDYFSGFDAKEEGRVNEVSVESIYTLMQSFDWNSFHAVTLGRTDDEWISVSGNLVDDGLSCIYSENGEQFVIDKAPSSINQMIDILTSYFNEDGRFKAENSFNGEFKEYKLNPTTVSNWEEEFARRQKEEKKTNVKRSAVALVVVILISLVSYYWYVDELQFFGQKTEFVKAEVISTKMHHIGNGYYKQIVTYQFTHKEKVYMSSFKIGKSIGRRTVGEFLKIKFSVVNPKRSKIVGFYKTKGRNRNVNSIKSRQGLQSF